MYRLSLPVIILLASALFIATSWQYTTSANIKSNRALGSEDRVVISAPVQLLFYAGDRFLGANLETMRLLTTTSTNSNEATTLYQIRAHNLITQLNACHEDNYYIAAAVLSWGGAEKEGSDILKRATKCREWDWIPPFYFALNQYFFHRDHHTAEQYMRVAAERSPTNRSVLTKTAIMLSTKGIDDDNMVLNHLKNERDQAKDPKLVKMLDKRVARLEGLILLRNAQKKYEKETGTKLTDPNELLSRGYLKEFPTDPLGIGYEFSDDGRMQLRTLNIR